MKLAALTNGRTWWLYLPLQAGSWEQRRFLTIDLEAQDLQTVEQRFMDYLSEEKVSSGQAAADAEEAVRSQQRTEITNKAVAEAWKQIVETPDEILIDLISETAERICGFKPETELIQQFLAQESKPSSEPLARSEHSQPPSAPPEAPRPAPLAGTAITGPQQLDGKNLRPESITFQGQRQRTRSWNDVLIELCGIISELRPRDFDTVLTIRRTRREGAKWPYHFSRNSSELRKPKGIPNSGIYAEVDLDATTMVRLAYGIVEHFGYPPGALTIHIQQDRSVFFIP